MEIGAFVRSRDEFSFDDVALEKENGASSRGIRGPANPGDDDTMRRNP
jgi:hypothetical protein